MKKFLTVFVLLSVIIVTFSIIILSLLARGSENNFFNAKYRSTLAQFSIIRKLVGLHDPGDAKAGYLGKQTQDIVVEVDEMSPLQIPNSVLDELVKNISAATGKQARYVISDSDIPFQDSVTDAQIDQIAKQYRNFFSSGSQASVYLLYLNQYQDQTSHLGSTYREDGILLFDNALREFSQYYPENKPEYTQSTALHEFGHLLGLDHNSTSGCLMQAQVDDYDSGAKQNGIVTNFCDLELQQIKAIQSSL